MMRSSPNLAQLFDSTYVMTYAHFGWNRLKGGHFVAVQNLPFSHDFNGWPYNRQALTCCRDCLTQHFEYMSKYYSLQEAHM